MLKSTLQKVLQQNVHFQNEIIFKFLNRASYDLQHIDNSSKTSKDKHEI